MNVKFIYQGFEIKASSVGANKSVEQSFYQKRARTNRLRFVDYKKRKVKFNFRLDGTQLTLGATSVQVPTVG